MQLHLIRHAIAEAPVPGLDDAMRGITERGSDRMRRGVRGLARLDIRYGALLSSPKRRALETASLLEPLCDQPFESEELLALPPGAALLSRVRDQPCTTVGLVGHEPWLSQLASLLLTGDPTGMRLCLKKGAVCVLEGTLSPGGMTLYALWPNRVLRQLSG